VGVDFDNTIVAYDQLFHRCAVERGLVPAETPARKSAVRAFLWCLPGGNTAWTELQAIVYGVRIAEAEPAPGVVDFLRQCEAQGVRVSVISHKLEFPALGPRINLHQAARRWLQEHNLYAAGGGGLQPARVFFEASQEAKSARIIGQRCTHFVDDLLEMFRAPHFPAQVARLLYQPVGEPAGEGIESFRSWEEIGRYFQTIVGDGRRAHA
jgi:hypothetical protein